MVYRLILMIVISLAVAGCLAEGEISNVKVDGIGEIEAGKGKVEIKGDKDNVMPTHLPE
jgi:hypothetical protein